MKPSGCVLHLKTLIRQGITLFCLCCALTACAGMDLPHWFTGEPDESVTGAAANHAGIARMNTEQKDYPNLASVPEKPDLTAVQEDKATTVRRMQQDNRLGQVLQQRMAP